MEMSYNPKLKVLARNLRNNSTKAEIRLWNYLRNNQIYEYDFHRQKPIDNFIVDFFCNKLKLVIEVDGFSHQHEETYEKDIIKENKLKNIELKVLRFNDEEVLNDIYNVLRTIELYIEEFENKYIPSPS